MKLIKLSLKNINSFRDKKVEIDFESSPLNDASLLAITGATGSGKTTLLDALCVALYGKTPRLSSTGSQNPGNLLSQGKTEGFAEVVFETNGARYRTEWRVKRSRKGDLKPEAKLINGDTGELITDRMSSRGRSRGTSDMVVSEAVASILGLEFDAFTRSVMLAQGDFAAFLKANAEARRQILEATTGIDIYESLKNALNEKVRVSKSLYEQDQATFDAIPVATCEDIEAAKARRDALKANAETLGQKRSDILRQREQEARRVGEHQKLTEVKARHEELESRQDEFEEQQSELELARRAAKLLPQQQAFQSEQGDAEAAQEGFEKAERAFVKRQQEYRAGQDEFAKIDVQYQEVLAGRETKMEAYNNARAEEIKAQAQFDRLKEQQANAQTIEKGIDELSQRLASQKEERDTLSQQIEADQAFLRDNPIPNDSDERLSSAKAILVQLDGKRGLLSEKEDTRDQLRSKTTRLKRQLAGSEKKREGQLLEKTAADTALTQAESERKAQQERGSLDTWETRKGCAQRMLPIAHEYEEAIGRLKAEQDDLDGMRGDKDSVESDLGSRVQKLEVQTETVRTADERVKRRRAEREYALVANQVIALRQRLEDNQPCPVCGAMEHPWGDKAELDGKEQIERAAQNLAEAEEARRTQEDVLNDLQRECTRLEAEQANLDRQMDQSRTQITELETVIASKQAQWQEIYPDAEVSSSALQEQIDAADESIGKLHEASRGHAEALNNQKLVAQSLDENEREIERIKGESMEAEAQYQEAMAEIDTLVDEIRHIDGEFWRVLPDEFRGDEPKNALDQFSAQLDAVRTCEKQLVEKQNLFDRFNDRVAGGERELADKRKSATDVKAEIKRYQAEGDKLLGAAREKTDGMTAEDAISKLELTVKEKTEGRDRAEQERREQENRLTQAETNRDNAESHRAACLKKFEDAQQMYLTALTEGGFDSPEAHEGAFRDDAWMKKCADELDQYQRDQHTTAEKMATLWAHFADAPFDPQELERIQAEEQSVDAEFQSTAQGIGEVRQRIGELDGNFRRREAQGAMLEQARGENERWERLQEYMPQNKLRDFALERMFDLLIRLANKQLHDLTGRYQLKVQGMHDMAVIDKWNANEERPVETLSGGESFLTSLSLALALSEMSRGRTQLNSLFLDEGFGTLDAKTLDIAISALEGLRTGGRNVVVISHVGELTRRIPVQIAVEKMGNGSSRVHIPR